MKRIIASLLITTLTLSAGSAFASRGDIAAGKEKAVVCQACHGADGNAVDPQYPRLAGQYRDYIARALHEYKSGGRKNPIMAGFATPLSDEDIQNLAAYFASLPDGKLTDLHKHVE